MLKSLIPTSPKGKGEKGEQVKK